jgi:heme-degrading monooxygenase HmoA
MIQDQTILPDHHEGEVILVNRFTAKPGQMQKFVAAQTGEYKRLLGKVAGWKGNRLHLSLDGTSAVNYAVFESLEYYNAWRDSELFKEHVAVIAPFVEKSEPGIYQALYQAGTI